MELGNQMKKYRAELGISQDALAEKIYVSRQTISNWETGKNYPRTITAKKPLSQFISVCWIMRKIMKCCRIM